MKVRQREFTWGERERPAADAPLGAEKAQPVDDTPGKIVAAGLFAGIGGFELGLADAGAEVVMLCESGPAARAVLEARFPKVQLAGDIKEVKELPRGVNLVTAGFP